MFRMTGTRHSSLPAQSSTPSQQTMLRGCEPSYQSPIPTRSAAQRMRRFFLDKTSSPKKESALQSAQGIITRTGS